MTKPPKYPHLRVEYYDEDGVTVRHSIYAAVIFFTLTTTIISCLT